MDYPQSSQRTEGHDSHLPLFADQPIIRLLQLSLHSDSKGVESIHGSVATYDLRDKPDYDALSYAWGTPNLSAQIVLNNESFPVTQTLFAALQQICSDNKETNQPRKLWVDAICINQMDNAGKSHQVLLMRDIYSNATSVLAWIGAPDHLRPRNDKQPCNSAGTSTPKVTITASSDVIGLEGSQFDIISRVLPIKSLLGAGEDGSVSVNESILRELAASIIPSETYPFGNESSWVAYFRTLTADRSALSPRINEQYWSQFFTAFSDWGLHHSSGDCSNLPLSAWGLVSRDIGTIIEDKDMFVTEKWYFGLGHEGVKEGDVVVVLTGGEVPLVLRVIGKDENERRLWRFLCEVYVHGIMDGEVVEDPTRAPLEEFMIR